MSDDSIIAREEISKLTSAFIDQVAINGELQSRMKVLEEELIEKKEEIKEMRVRQNELMRDFDELAKIKTELENEIVRLDRRLQVYTVAHEMPKIQYTENDYKNSKKVNQF